MNIYEHVICFDKADGNDNTYFHAKALHDSLEAQIGDTWRWLAPKSMIQGIDHRYAAIALVSPLYKPQCGDPLEVNAIRYHIGRVRAQESEKYVDLSIWVNALPTPGTWKQFAIQRANGQIVIGTFKGQQTTRTAYMNALKEFYESLPYTKVLCDVDGSKMRIRIWEKQGVFKLADEGLLVGLGTTDVTNTNNPSIDKIDLGEFTYPASDSYLVEIGPSVLEGNIFNLDSETYIAVAGDTPQSVREKLFTGDRYVVLEDSAVTVSVEAGTRTISNTNKLNVQAVFDSALSGDDRYLIKINGALQPGNVIQVSATGKTTKSYTVLLGDALSDIEDYFNSETGGFYIVDGGVIPQVSFIAGIQTVDNTNSPTIKLTGYQNIPSHSVRRWRIIIGPDLRAGNIFHLDDLAYTVSDGDTALDIASHFGYDSVSFTVETEVSAAPDAYALKGYLYQDSNIADVTISDGPRLARSSQYVFEAEFNCDIDPGTYRLALIDTKPEEATLLSLGNQIIVKSKAKGEIFEAADQGDVFGFEYYENGLTQRMRLPVFIQPPRHQSEEDRIVKFMGGYDRTTTKIEFVSKLVTIGGLLPLHTTIASFLKHSHLRIGGKQYYNSGEYAETLLDPSTGRRQATTDIVELSKEKNNFLRYRSNYYQSGSYGGYCKVLAHDCAGRLQIWLRSSEIVRQIEDWQLLNTASYQLIAETFDNVNLSIYRDGNRYLTAFLPKGQRVRLSGFIKFETGSNWIIQTSLADACYSIPEIIYICEESKTHTIIYDCETIEKPAFGEFSDDFGSDLTT
ncbi:hypothetical protein GCM10007423_39900 [Dyadobacter endophyticus]|uniref:Uncharacterized protein n=1 Tax=Dyadobacter endophyticus TaxID=1749036 RepID=A0ABQ1Z0H6_9BACT|nr:hypothetical protein [Dyadobacter endophyticus]GGH42911.1 hypothetical protein GCM10007423_39900 [Dyadobacter endophyticus]